MGTQKRLQEKTKRRKINRRNQAKYPALRPELNLKTRYNEIDYDYLDKLSDKEKQWLNNFTEEYVHANLNHRGKKLHKTKKLKKSIYDRNNARNRDSYTKLVASGQSVRLNDLTDNDLNYDEQDSLIRIIDLKNELKKTKKFKRASNQSTNQTKNS